MKVMYTITGGSGVGKSTISDRITRDLGTSACLIELESYYLPFEDIPARYNGRPNLDVLEAFDLKKLHTHLEKLANDPAGPEIIVFEGFLAQAALPANYRYPVYHVYLDAAHELRFSRRQGEMMDKEYEQNVLIPMHYKHVEPQRHVSDLVIDVTHKSIPAVVDILKQYISSTNKYPLSIS